MPEFTVEQRRAIEERGSNLLLSAAAGSGKTTVLVERVLSRIERDRASIDRMLVVTFTRAAAQDMRAKLSERFTWRASQPDALPIYREQLNRLERASITTLHAFCAEFLRAHFEAAGVDPAFQVLDDAVQERLLEEALDEALEEAYAEADEAMLTLDDGRGPAQVRALLERLCRFLEERPQPEQWLEAATDMDRVALWTRELVFSARRVLAQARLLLRQATELAGCTPQYLEAMRADIEGIDALMAMDDYDQLYRALDDMKLTTPKRGKKGDVTDEAAMKQVKDLREQARAALKRIRLVEYPLEQCILDLRAQQPQVRRLGALALRTLAILDEKKAELGGLSYSDLERFTLAALRDEDTARAVREQYDDIFVDEYQDTSDIQEAIVSRICGKDNRFMVGDVKQSIYRFRQAEPRLFLEKYREYGVGNGGTLLPLTRNFRSRPTVLEFVNTVFERAMIGGDTEIEYDELARLHPGRTFDTPDMPVEIHLLEKLSQEDGEIDEAISEMKDAEREGLLIARRIRELMQEDASLRYRDIAILTRTGAQTAAAMMPHLLAAGIPAYSDSSAGYFDTLEVSLAISMLRVLANRRSDVALIGVLRSPAAQLNAESLAQIRILYRDCSFADASWRVAWGVPLGEIPTEEGELPQGELAEGLRAFWSAMEGWRLLLHSMELGALLRKMLLESGVYTYMGALPGGAQRQANLGRLVDVAGRFDREVSGSLPRFLRHVEKLKNRGEGEAAHLLGENDDVVRIMTIHKSKGLEFRAVFGALLNRRYRAAQAEALSVHRDLGLSFAHYDPALRSRRKTLAQAAIGERMNREDAAEEMRVLYVLLTRAKERLILTGSVKDIDKSQKTWLAIGALPQMAKSHLELIMGALLAAQSEGKHTYAEMHMHALSELNLSEAEPERAQVAFERALEGAANAADQAAIEEMEWVYPEPLGAGQPLKLTVSGLLRNLEGPQSLPDILERPQFMQDAAIRPLTGAERGTAYHRAMQLLDWSRFEAMPLEATTKEIAAQLAQFAAERLMTEAQVEAVQPSRIARFFLSDTGERLRRAEEVHREWAFNVSLRANEALSPKEAGRYGSEPLLVQGTVDCCFLEGGEWVLLDYKTDRADDLDALAAHYRNQLAVYALALERITGRSVKQRLLCLLGAGREIEV